MNNETVYPDLKTLLAKYDTATQRLVQAQKTVLSLENSPTVTIQDVWKEEPVVETLQQSCGDGAVVNLKHEYQQYTYRDAKVDQLEQSLCNLSDETNRTLYECLYQAKMTKLAVQDWLENIMWSLNMRSNIISGEKQQVSVAATIGEKDTTDLYKDDMTILSRVLNTLFTAEQTSTNEIGNQVDTTTMNDNVRNNDAYLEQLHTWILNIGSAFIKCASLTDYKYLLLQLYKSKQATEWGVTLIQYIPDGNILEFMAEYHLALGCVLDNPTDSPWQEEDYINCLDQLDVPFVCAHFVDSIFQQDHPLDHASATHSAEFFDLSNSLIDALLAGIRLASSKNYSNLKKRLAQQISQASVTLTSELKKHNTWSEQCQPDGDDFIVHVVTGLLSVSDSDVWHFLPSLPFDIVSSQALWEITLKLLQITDYAEPSNLRSAIKNPPVINSFLQQVKGSPTQGVFMISCLTNVVTSISSGVGKMSSSDTNNSLLGASLVAIIAHALFTIAFVDQDLNDIYYKDVRDNFGIICSAHPFVISLLLRWTCDHLAGMENMALYLFRSLPLDRWEILTDDLTLLYQLLQQSEQSLWVTFAQYVIGQLNFGYCQEPSISTGPDPPHSSHPWCQNPKQPFLPYRTHEDLAFLILDSCQKYQSLYDFDKDILGSTKASSLFTSTKHTAAAATPSSSSVSINATSHQHFLDWCWTVVQQLQLYHTPLSSRASDMDKCIDLAFLKACLNQPAENISSHGALLVFVAFLLSPTSRHFLRFESGHGWMKLLVILRRGKCTAAIHLLGEIVPAFIYLHGDDFFTGDDSVVDYLRNMVEHKKDPMLRQSAQYYIDLHSVKGNKKVASRKTDHPASDFWYLKSLNGIGFVIGSHAWHCHVIDTTSDLNGFSYLNLVLYSWLYTVFRKDDWMWSEQYVTIVDDICYIAYCLDQQSLVYKMLEKEMERLEQIKSPSPKPSFSVSPKLMPLVGQPRKALKYIKNMLPDSTYATLLTGEWSMLSLTTNNLFKTPGVEPNSLWFAFKVLLLETAKEKDDRCAFTQLLLAESTPIPSPTSSSSSSSSPVPSNLLASPSSHSMPLSAAFGLLQYMQQPDNDFKILSANSKKPVDFYCVYRILQHILVAPFDHPVMPLLLQIFFCLFYANMAITNGDGTKKKIFYGAAFFAKKQDQLAKLRDRIASLQTYHGQQGMAPANSFKTRDDQTIHEQTTRHHEHLRQIYYAMWLWLGSEDLLTQGGDTGGIYSSDLEKLPAHYCPQRLLSCLQATTMDTWENHQPWIKYDALWYDLVDNERIKTSFSKFGWVDSGWNS
ncbi:hypothetical protein BC941DRAFT_516094 [Chlamydoabsidia padenii]|nr:hypothetical protein BC941DRAFT_516094 [Chlamydoabsidia padenii]